MGKVIMLNNWKGGRVAMDYTKLDLDEKVKDLLKKYNMTDIPVDPIKLANLMGIKVTESEFADPGVSGVMKRDAEQITITVNRKNSLNRKRFTVAHELGHLELGHRPKQGQFAEIYRNGESNPKEQQANQFAAALLVNKKYLKDLYNSLKKVGLPNNIALVLLADKFQVSQQTIKYRLSSIGKY